MLWTLGVLVGPWWLAISLLMWFTGTPGDSSAMFGSLFALVVFACTAGVMPRIYERYFEWITRLAAPRGIKRRIEAWDAQIHRGHED